MQVQAQQDLENWWRGGVIYQIYPRSFADSNGDGVGDLPGITARLDYVARLGVDAVWLSPFFKSPMKDFGYDVSDYRAVDPLFGTLDDFDALVARAHGLGLKVMIDLVMSHSSDQHAWFKESRSSRDNARADWYVWADAQADGTPPNNWLSLFGGTAWQWDSRRGQYYLHNFLSSQPDLNFHNPQVRQQMLSEVEFWLKRGVDGLRLDVVNFYFHDAELRSNPPAARGAPRADGVPLNNPYAWQNHVYDKTRPENLAFLQDLRSLLNRYPGSTSVGEIGSDDPLGTMADYTADGDKLHMAYTFNLLTPNFSADHIRATIAEMEARIGDGWPCWSIGNHDIMRVMSRWGQGQPALAKMLMAMLLSMRGSVCIYQGEELGLTEADVPFEQLQDPYGITFWPEFKGRDGCRTPMPWVAQAEQGGFSTGKPWLPMAAEHLGLAVDVQETASDSVLQAYRAFLAWRRQHPALQQGSIALLDSPADTLLWVRELDGERVLAAFNLSAAPVEITLPAASSAQALAGHGFNAVYRADAVRLPAFGAAFATLTGKI